MRNQERGTRYLSPKWNNHDDAYDDAAGAAAGGGGCSKTKEYPALFLS